jgi:hypothetical protein
MARKRQSHFSGPFVGVPKAIMQTPAWREMSPYARLVWIELRGWLSNDGSNNGKIFAPCRDFGEAIGIDKDTVHRALAENEHFGFLRRTGEGFLGIDGHGIAARYRFTDLACDARAATRDYEKWDGELFTYQPRRPARKKQNPVPLEGTACPAGGDIRSPQNRVAVCPAGRDIKQPQPCPAGGDISSFPSPASEVAMTQGSLTARAPAQAGGAGSSPAPVSKVIPFPDERGRRDSLMSLVASVVGEQLDRLDARRRAA